MSLDLLQAPGFGDERIVHAFTTRTGGVSEGPYASLNLSWSRGDAPARIEDNRERVSRALGLERLIFANQIHSAVVLKVDGVPEEGWSVGAGDALITNKPGLGLCAQTADCTPVLLYDREHQAIAAIHAGWRGAVAQIIAATVEQMARAYGTRPEGLRAAIGPAISQPNYRVGPEVLEQFENLLGPLDSAIKGPRDDEGGAGLDVSEVCRRQLLGLGVTQISHLAHCTFANEDRFFSSRRAARDGHPGVFGGQVGVIGLKA